MMNEREESAFSEKDQEIIAVGASVAAGCLPCTKFHLKGASGVGAGDEEILQAVRDAARVRSAAAAIMAMAGGLSPAEADRPIRGGDEGRSLIRELVSISAAYAVNCTTSLRTHMTAARALGATDRQLFTAVRIACDIRDVAVQKAKAAVGAVLGLSEEQTAASDCCGDDTASAAGASNRALGARQGRDAEACNCRTDESRRSDE
jgi:AhpD family alkylhydroperoxidase